MSADKHRALSRRLRILRSAALNNGRVMFHREGGRAMNTAEVSRLIADGYLVIRRHRPNGDHVPKRFESRFAKEVRNRGSLHGWVNVTWGYITESGRAFLRRFPR